MDEIQSGLTFNRAKELADRAIQDVKNGIVVAGYALRAIRNEKLWKEHGYASFDVFMEICYQKDKSWASNCIRVYEQFGELAGPEQAPRLQERYQEYSAGGLIEMLSMPEKMREQVTADMPVREIRELKREARKVATSQPEEEQLPGQMDITDFLDEPEKEQEPEEIIFLPELKTFGSFVLAAEDLAEEGLDEEQAAGRQQETGCPPGTLPASVRTGKPARKTRNSWKTWKNIPGLKPVLLAGASTETASAVNMVELDAARTARRNATAGATGFQKRLRSRMQKRKSSRKNKEI